VGIAVDGASTYGRAVMRGAMQYINAQQRWEIFSVLRGTFDTPPIDWPKCDGAIIAGAHGDLVKKIWKQSRYPISCSGAAPTSDPKARISVTKSGIFSLHRPALSNGKARTSSILPPAE